MNYSFSKYRLRYITLAGVLLLFACSVKKSGSPPTLPPQQVTVESVLTSDAVYFDEYPATLSALNQTELRAQVSGYVTGVYFQDGQKVTKGQRLYSIDAQVYNANYQQSIANLQVQETNVMKAQKDADRYHELAFTLFTAALAAATCFFATSKEASA